MSLEKTKRELKKLQHLLESYKVSELYIFGSVSRGTDTAESDLDLIVKFSEPITMFEFVRLKNSLEASLERKVDLVCDDMLHPELETKIWKEAIRAA